MATPFFAGLETSELALMIPIVAIICGCSIPVAAIISNYRRRKHLFELYHQERMAAIAKGVDLPPLPDDLLADGEPERPRVKSPRDSLLKGLVWLFVGLGIVAALFGIEGPDTALLGLIPAGVGLAHLIYFFVEGRNASNQTGPDQRGT
jgi:hypothetical protein